jgi:hypothetical protein
MQNELLRAQNLFFKRPDFRFTGNNRSNLETPLSLELDYIYGFDFLTKSLEIFWRTS